MQNEDDVRDPRSGTKSGVLSPEPCSAFIHRYKKYFKLDNYLIAGYNFSNWFRLKLWRYVYDYRLEY
mgnify:FL=1